MKHLENWERRAAHGSLEARGERNQIIRQEANYTCDRDGCNKVCMSKAGLVNHRKRIHLVSKEKVVFKCDDCNTTYKSKGSLVNHKKSCGGAVASREGFKKCNNCQREITSNNFKRHRRTCVGEEEQRIQICQRTICGQCGTTVTKPNLSRHKKYYCPMGVAVP